MDYHFDAFSLDITNRCLMIGSELVDIDERAFDLFELLIQAYPNDCGKQLLVDKIWQDTVVSDWSLSKLVSDTRKTFKLAGYSGPLIQTVHGRGYKLDKSLWRQIKVADQQETAASITTSNSHSTNDPKSKLKTPHFTTFSAGALAILVILTLIYFQWFSLGTPDKSTDPLAINEPQNAIGRILWVDDHPQNNYKERLFLEQNNIGVYSVTTTREALRLLSFYNYQAVISDMGRQDDSLAGLKLLEVMRQEKYQTPFFIYTWHVTDALKAEVAAKDGQGVSIDAESLYATVLPLLKSVSKSSPQ